MAISWRKKCVTKKSTFPVESSAILAFHLAQELAKTELRNRFHCYQGEITRKTCAVTFFPRNYH